MVQTRVGELKARLDEAKSDAERLRGELEEHRRAVLHDPLTGLLNRRGMDNKLQALASLDASTPMSALMIDIDHFKSVNDRFGHSIGDAVIKNIAQVIRACVRGSDIAVRYGGEEFLVMLPATRADGACTVAEAIRAKVETLRLVRKRDNVALPGFTVSVGVAHQLGTAGCEELVARADSALYQSKEGGRNRVSSA